MIFLIVIETITTILSILTFVKLSNELDGVGMTVVLVTLVIGIRRVKNK